MKTEHPEWAAEHGFKTGAEGFKEFKLTDADKIAQGLGLKLWDDKEEKKKFIVLHELVYASPETQGTGDAPVNPAGSPGGNRPPRGSKK